MKFTYLLFSFLGMGLFSHTALSGEGLFSRVYTTETTPGGHYELEQLVRNRRDRSFGNYSALDFKTEVEYGFTDAFQGAFYLNTGHIAAKNAPDDDDPNGATGFSRNSWFLQGFSTEFIYRFTSPVTDPLGFAIYFEPEYDFHDLHNGLQYDRTFEFEMRIILQKNFLDDQLIVAFNTIAELELIRFSGDDNNKGELDFNNELGATYRFAPNWYGGLEFRNHNELGNFNIHEHSVFWAGPALHYAGEKFWVTLGALYQLAGGGVGIHDGFDQNGTFVGDHTFLRSHERWEITSKVAFPF